MCCHVRVVNCSSHSGVAMYSIFNSINSLLDIEYHHITIRSNIQYLSVTIIHCAYSSLQLSLRCQGDRQTDDPPFVGKMTDRNGCQSKAFVVTGDGHGE
jgi:hypothetical protein